MRALWAHALLLSGIGLMLACGSSEPLSAQRPLPPDPPDDSCARFAPVYDGSDCSAACPEVSCGCASYPASECNQQLGCVVSYDCDAACAATGALDAYFCTYA